eukprot:g77184.t1
MKKSSVVPPSVHRNQHQPQFGVHQAGMSGRSGMQPGVALSGTAPVGRSMSTGSGAVYNVPKNPDGVPQIPNRLYQYVLDLTNSEKRDQALQALSQKREDFPELAPVLWHSFGTIAALLQEIVSIYPLLSPPRLTTSISNRCCNALALLQCVASHPETRSLFLNSHLGLFLYPFLNTVCAFRQYDYLRLTSLGVIGALVKMDDPDVINFLLQTEIIPLCLRIMDNGSELSKTVATFIIQKILLDDMGLSYICATYERFSTVSSVLSKMVTGIEERSSTRLLKHIVRCYLRLSDNQRAREALRNCLPSQLRDPAFAEDDPATKRWLTQLLYNIAGGDGVDGAGVK